MLLQLPNRHIRKWRSSWAGLGLLALCIGVVISVVAFWPTRADGPSWLVGDPELVSRRHLSDAEYIRRSTNSFCEDSRAIYVDDKPGAQPSEMDLCITQGDGFRVAVGYAEDSGRRISGISIGLDAKFYKLQHGGSSGGWGFVLIPGTKKFIIAQFGVNFSSRLWMYDNILDMLLFKNGGYIIDHSKKSPSWQTSSLVYGWGVSKNGRYVAYGVSPGISQYSWFDTTTLEDIETGHRGVFGNAVVMHLSYPNLPAEFAVSDDGRHIASTGGGGLKFWEITSGCLRMPSGGPVYSPEPCPSRRYVPGWYGNLGAYPSSLFLKVDSDFSELSYIFRSGLGDDPQEITLKKPGLLAEKKLDYLAIGDSYSSGEGDIVAGVSSFYIRDTGGKDGCHLSSRSYPFVLQKWWSIDATKMQSVGCSGARILHDYIPPMHAYMGQGGSLARLSFDERATKREAALAEFSPGTVPQLEFIKKYKPKVVTLTGGGNDVGFADILRYCASPTWEGLFMDDTCRYARHNSARQEFINSIRNQYGVMKNLLSKIRAVSPATKVYVVGYPQFLASPATTCAYNAASLNYSERSMIRDMVTEMNDVLWRAARDGGAEFIDIEDSLDGGQLCQGAKYVTGLHDIGTSNIRNENFMEAFHPNANGHLKIARSIYGQVPHFDGGASAVVRDAPSAAELTLAKLTRHIAMTADTLVEQASLSIKLDLYMLQPGSKASVVMYSDEVALGSFAVVDNGGLSVNIPLPDSIGPGRHALVLEGSSYSGEPITLYQFITVASATDGDADGDGIPDGIDRCPFIVSWYDEETGRDICINTDSVDSIGGLDPADNSDGGATEDASSSRDLARTGVPLPRWLLGTMLLVILSFVSAVIIKKEGYKNNVQRERSKKKQ